MKEIKNGQTVKIKFGSNYEFGKVIGVMGDYATVSVKALGKQITTKVDDMEPVEEENRNKSVEFSGHPGSEMEMFAEKYNLKRRSFYVDLCGIPAGSYFQMTKRDNLTVETWKKFEKGKALVEAMDKEDLKKYQQKPKVCVIPGFKRGCEENKKEPDKERMDLIEQLQSESKLNEIKEDKQAESEGAEMETAKTWLEKYKELIKSLSMSETLEFFQQVKTDSNRFEEMFNEIKEAII